MGYNFEKFCKDYENIENYEKARKDNFKNWDCHHRSETHNSDGERRLVDISKKELIALGMYYNRPASELIFLKHSEHNTLHHKGKHLGKDNHFYGKKHSEEARKKMREAKKNISEETRKKLSETKKGKHWYNNGKISKRAYECPEGFVPGRIKKL